MKKVHLYHGPPLIHTKLWYSLILIWSFVLNVKWIAIDECANSPFYEKKGSNAKLNASLLQSLIKLVFGLFPPFSCWFYSSYRENILSFSYGYLWWLTHYRKTKTKQELHQEWLQTVQWWMDPVTFVQAPTAPWLWLEVFLKAFNRQM